VIGISAFVIILPAIAPRHQPASWVFGRFAPDMAYSGITNQGFTFLLALLGSQWAMVGLLFGVGVWGLRWRKTT